MFISVDLPEPDAPMIATNSPGCDRERHAAQRVHLDVAHLVDLGDRFDLDDRGRTSVAGHQNIRLNAPAPAGRCGLPSPLTSASVTTRSPSFSSPASISVLTCRR